METLLKANKFNELDHEDQQVIKRFIDHPEFENIRHSVSVFKDMTSAEWIKEGISLLPPKLKIFLIGYYFAKAPEKVIGELHE